MKSDSLYIMIMWFPRKRCCLFNLQNLSYQDESTIHPLAHPPSLASGGGGGGGGGGSGDGSSDGSGINCGWSTRGSFRAGDFGLPVR